MIDEDDIKEMNYVELNNNLYELEIKLDNISSLIGLIEERIYMLEHK